MIIGDISEKKKTHDAFTKRLGENYAIKQLGVFDCEIEKVLLANGKKTFCASNEEAPILLDAGFEYLEIRPRCSKCDNRCYVRFADFEIAPKRAYFERKTAADFVASRKQRLYEQLIKMDMFVEDGRKGLILEIWLAWSPHKRGVMRKPILKNRPHPLPRPNGMPRDWKPKIKLQDSKGFFSGFDKKVHNLRGLSPLEIGSPQGNIVRKAQSYRGLLGRQPTATGDRNRTESRMDLLFYTRIRYLGYGWATTKRYMCYLSPCGCLSARL